MSIFDFVNNVNKPKTRNKALLNYQRGYAGNIVDLEAMKPLERKCYLLGVWHASICNSPLMTSLDVLQEVRVLHPKR